MGGVWFDSLNPTSPPMIVWRHAFPTHIGATLVTADNPSGTISISDLELAGVMIAQQDVLATTRPVRERTIWIASDNRAAVSWATKGSSMSLAARAHLLRFNALHQRAHHYVARHHYIPGPVNAMADAASRRWDLTDSELLTYFDTHFPQATSWQMRPLPSATSAASLIMALSNKRVPLASLLSDMRPPLPPGDYGRPFVPAWESNPTGRPTPTTSLSSKSLPNVTARGPSLPDANPSALGRWRKPYERWVRRTPGWGPLTLGQMLLARWIFASPRLASPGMEEGRPTTTPGQTASIASCVTSPVTCAGRSYTDGNRLRGLPCRRLFLSFAPR